MNDHHYAFAHRVVRDYVKNDPEEFLALVDSAERDDFVAWLWEQTERYVGEPLTGIDTKLTGVEVRTVARCRTVIVTLPPPADIGEAYMVAAMISPSAPDPTTSEARARYFTLEFGMSMEDEGEGKTVLCEWMETRHRNYGPGPAPNVDAFAEQLACRASQ